MQKNVAGQKIGAQLVTAADGTAFTGAVTVAVTIDAGTQAAGTVGGGAGAHEGNGYHTYAPSPAETNGTLVAFTFTGTGAVPATVQVFTTGPELAAIQAKTDALPADPADASDLAASFTTVNTKLDTISGKTAGLPADPASAATIAASFATVNTKLDTVDAVVDAIKLKTDTLPADPAGQAATAAAITAALTTAIADSVPADGTRPSIAQALYMIVQILTEKSVSGTTMSIKKPDGMTQLLTLTLNDATNPTAVTRAS